jgi:hypothetical protein
VWRTRTSSQSKAATYAGAASSDFYYFITSSPQRGPSTHKRGGKTVEKRECLQIRSTAITNACKQLILHTGSHMMRVNKKTVCLVMLSGLVSY